MATLRELVRAIRQRPGIDAAVVVGRDGLVIAGDASPHVDLDEMAARVPPLLTALRELTTGNLTAVIEHRGGHIVFVSLNGDEAALLLFAAAAGDVAPLVSDLRRYRDRIAGLV
jgi:uncharacterized protein